MLCRAEYFCVIIHFFRFDPLNEYTLQPRIQRYVALGKHSLAKKAYERFAREYSEAYGQKFGKSFIDIR
ncbi:MAG: hypothetical protein LUF85_00450 [Bacteroides sp.]|nr:hypothetical protein [Bacteroides sp.]